MNSTVEYIQSREMWPFQYLCSVWKFQFEESKKRYDFGDYTSDDFNPTRCEGWKKFKSAGFVFLSFWAECYINYALNNIYPNEHEYLERIKTIEKMELISSKLSIDFDDYKSAITTLFKFRNSLAHGKEHNPSDKIQTVPLEKFHKINENINPITDLNAMWEDYLKSDENKTIKKLMNFFDKIQKKAELKFHAKGVSDLKMRSSCIK